MDTLMKALKTDCSFRAIKGLPLPTRWFQELLCVVCMDVCVCVRVCVGVGVGV